MYVNHNTIHLADYNDCSSQLNHNTYMFLIVDLYNMLTIMTMGILCCLKSYYSWSEASSGTRQGRILIEVSEMCSLELFQRGFSCLHSSSCSGLCRKTFGLVRLSQGSAVLQPVDSCSWCSHFSRRKAAPQFPFVSRQIQHFVWQLWSVTAYFLP